MWKIFLIVGAIILVVGAVLAILFPNLRNSNSKKKTSSFTHNHKSHHKSYHERDRDHDGTPDWRDDDPHDPFES